MQSTFEITSRIWPQKKIGPSPLTNPVSFGVLPVTGSGVRPSALTSKKGFNMQAPQGLTLSEKDSFAKQQFDALSADQHEGGLYASRLPDKASAALIIAVWLVALLFCALVFGGLGFLLVAFDATFIGSTYQLPEFIIPRAILYSAIGLGHVLPCGVAVWMGYLMTCGFLQPHKRSAEF